MAKCDIHNHIYQDSSTCVFCDNDAAETWNGMYMLMSDVKLFHVACDVPIAATVAIPSIERVELRVNLIDEEINQELLPALIDGSLIDIADAMADSIYVIVGAALEFGIPLDKVWQAVQRANMTKVGADGKVRKREDGKVLKPEGWTPPDIASLLVVKEASGD